MFGDYEREEDYLDSLKQDGHYHFFNPLCWHRVNLTIFHRVILTKFHRIKKANASVALSKVN